MSMEKMMIDCEYFEEPSYVPKELCSIDRLGGVDDVDSCGKYCERVKRDCTKCAIQKCFNRLAEYEKIELTPDQIREIDKLYTEKCKEVANLQASLEKLREYQELEAKGLLIRKCEAESIKRECEICKCRLCVSKDVCCESCEGYLLGCEEFTEDVKIDNEAAVAQRKDKDESNI